MRIKIITSLSILVLFFILTDCASTSKSTADKVQAAKEFQKGSEKGTVYLYRLGKAVGAAGQNAVQVNGRVTTKEVNESTRKSAVNKCKILISTYK